MAKKTSQKSRKRAAGSRSRAKSSKRAATSRKKVSPAAAWGGRLRAALASSERKRDLFGLVALLVGALTLVWLATPQRSALAAAWIDFLRWAFGWGVFLAPLILLAGGLRLILRRIGDRLPSLRPQQMLGVVLLVWLALAGLHGFAGALEVDRARALADRGGGGGILGGLTLALLVQGLGVPGATLVMAGWLLTGVMLSTGWMLPDMLAPFGRGLARLGERLRPPRTATGRTTAPPLGSAAEVQPEIAETELDAPMEPFRPGGTMPAAGHERVPSWSLPSVDEVLEPGAKGRADEAFDRERAQLIEETLRSFGAPARVVEINRGPVITQFGVEPDFVEGRGDRRTKVKVSKISALADDLALALAAPSIRIEAPVPSKGYVGIEVPNPEVSLVALRDVMESEAFQRLPSSLRLGLGKDVSGKPVAADLAAMPHLLIAGTTGSGKSVCVNAIISCLLLQNTPDMLKFVMVDPKRVELTYYNGIPHLLAPVVVELERVVPALQWVSREMDRRYHLFSREGVRNLEDYNRRMEAAGERPLHTIVVVIDELADLMMLAPDETERVITRLAQLARATGIHLVIATQRPSVDVVTGLIKANFPARIAFAVASSVDSRVILDQPGAERLLGRGDMLFQAPDAAAPIRMQGAFVSENELQRLIQHWRLARLDQEPEASRPTTPHEGIPAGASLKQAPLWEELQQEEQGELDPLFDEAVSIVRQMRRASISLLQRRLRIGYTRAARLVDQLEAKGIVGPAQRGSQPREVLDYGELEGGEGVA